MATVVIDASAVVEIFTGRQPDPELRRKAMVNSLTAPEVVDVEVVNVVRRLERAGHLHPDVAARAVARLVEAPIVRATHRPLVRRIWELRHSITAYDAAYIALAEQLGVPLVTCDAKLATAHGHQVEIELYPRG